MDIIATDLLALLVGGVLTAAFLALVAIAQRAKHKPRLPDCYGIFTHEESLRLSAVKDCFDEMEERIIEDIPLFDETAEPIAPPPPPKERDGPPLWRE